MQHETIKIKQKHWDIYWHMSLEGRMAGRMADERRSEGTRERGDERAQERETWQAGETWNDTQERLMRHHDKTTWKLNIAAQKILKNIKPKYYTHRNHKTPLILKGWDKWPKTTTTLWKCHIPVNKIKELHSWVFDTCNITLQDIFWYFCHSVISFPMFCASPDNMFEITVVLDLDNYTGQNLQKCMEGVPKWLNVSDISCTWWFYTALRI